MGNSPRLSIISNQTEQLHTLPGTARARPESAPHLVRLMSGGYQDEGRACNPDDGSGVGNPSSQTFPFSHSFIVSIIAAGGIAIEDYRTWPTSRVGSATDGEVASVESSARAKTGAWLECLARRAADKRPATQANESLLARAIALHTRPIGSSWSGAATYTGGIGPMAGPTAGESTDSDETACCSPPSTAVRRLVGVTSVDRDRELTRSTPHRVQPRIGRSPRSEPPARRRA
jgi:hypothetical protein